MPLNTQIIRNGQPLQLPWGDFHVAAMALAASFDSPGSSFLSDVNGIYELDDRAFECYPDAAFPIDRDLAFQVCSYPILAKTPLNEGSYTLTKRHRFMDYTDGEILSLYPGDKLIAVRG